MKEKLLSYSQELEDVILYSVLGDSVKKGFYIDVGANDPWEISVTKLFYEIGWNGINIEPLLHAYELLNGDRKRDINVQVGIGASKGEMPLFITPGSGTGSTFDEDVAKKFIGAIEKKKVPIVTLTDICSEYIPSVNEDINFCKIDVEGFEKEVLQGFDMTKYRPWIMVMESTEPGTTIPSYSKWEHILLENRYFLAHEHGINRYYLREESRELSSKFISVEKLKDIYELYQVNKLNDNKNNMYYRAGEIVLFPAKIGYRMFKKLTNKLRK